MASLSNVTGLTTIEDFESSPDLWMIGDVDVGNPSTNTITYKQGSQCGSCNIGFSSSWLGGLGVKLSSSEDMSGSGYYLWIWVLLIPSMMSVLETKANGGLRLRLYSGTLTDDGDDLITNSSNNWKEYYVGGKDTLSLGWNRIVVNPTNLTAVNSGGTLDLTDVTLVGFTYKLASNFGGGSAQALHIDAIHKGSGISFSGGTSGDEIDFDTLSDYTEDSTRTWGICQYDKGVYRMNGEINIGVASQTTYFKDDGQLVLFEDQSHYTGSDLDSNLNDNLHKLKGTAGTTTDIEITNSVLISGGDYGKFGLSFDSSSVDLTLTGNTITNANSVKFASGQTINGKFNSCSQIDPNSATFTDFIISGYTGTNGALKWNTNIKDGSFKNNSRAIEHTSSTDATYDNLKFSGDTYSVNNSSGSSLDIYLKNGSDADDESTTGSTVNFYNYPVDTTITVQETDGTAISGARVLAYASDSTGDLPYQDSVTITSSGTTATVSHTAHGLATDDKVLIEGANQSEYNGVHQITVTGANSYTYTISGSPASPATGTITSTGVVLSGTTDSNGEITINKSFSKNQPITGRVRKATSTPLYQQGNISGTINYLTGLDLTVMLVSDE